MQKVDQASDSVVTILGAAQAVIATFPDTNADGTPNPAAQSAAVTGMVAALQGIGFVPTLDPAPTPDQWDALAKSLYGTITAYKTATKRTTL